MHLTPDEFRRWPHRAITLLGMSGVGKTTLARRLPTTSWFHYSGDYRIGTRYVREPFIDDVKHEMMKVPFLRALLRSDSIYVDSNITYQNLEPIAAFLGKLGSPAKGGLPLAEFQRRQALHLAAEAAAMRDVADFIEKGLHIYGYDHFVNDAGGSVCEIDDPGMFEVLARHTLILYLQAGEDMEEELIRRARANPKPLYYRADFLEPQLASYLREHGLASDADVDPDEFVRWVFPRLVQHRRPRYARIARDYGYTIDARRVADVRDEQDFIELVVEAIRGRVS